MSNETAKQALAKSTTETVVSLKGTEIATTAASAQVKALVEARFTIAVHIPRSMLQVRQELIKECGRPSFALEDVEGKGNSALYRKPVGGNNYVEGLGIRFAEVAERCMGNMMSDAITIQETDAERVKYCFVLDLQTNNSWGDTVHIGKTVERRSLKEGQVALKSRRNSSDKIVYTVEADEDALATKEAALISKKMRTLILRMIPGDLQDECITEIKKVRRERIVDNPDEAVRAITDLLFKVNISIPMVEAFLKHPVDQCTPEEIVNLQGLYSSLRSGDTTWAEIMDNAETARVEAEEKKGGNEAMREKVAAQQTAPQTPVTQPAASVPAQATPTAPTQPQTQPATTPATSAAVSKGGVPPWLNKGAAQPAAQTAPEQPINTAQTVAEPTMEEKVAQMAAEKAAEPSPVATGPRHKPKHSAIKKVPMPEFSDRAGGEGAWTPDQYARMEAALKNIPGDHGVEQTVFEWIGLPLEQVNTETIEACITVLNNWKVKPQ